MFSYHLVFIFFIISGVFSKTVLDAEIDRRLKGIENYVSYVTIGTPHITYKLLVDFDYDKIVIWRNMKTYSTSYTTDNGGIDWLIVGRESYRIPVVSDPYRRTLYGKKQCLDCEGVIGLSPSSVIWKIWPEISFSRSRIILGDINPEISHDHLSESGVLHCKNRTGFCHTFGRVKSNSFDEKLNIIIDPSSQEIVIPYKLYDRYMYGKNVYKDDYTSWDQFEFNLETEDPTTVSDISIKASKTNISFKIDPASLIHYTTNNGRYFLLKRGNDNENMQLGTEFLKKFVSHKSGNFLFIQSFNTTDELPTPNLILFTIQLVLLIRWVVINIDLFEKSYDYSFEKHWISLMNEIVGIGITISAFFLPSTFRILSSMVNIYIGTVFILAFSLAFEIYGFLIRWGIMKKKLIYLYTNSFERNIITVSSHCIILLTGLWLLFLESRLDGDTNLVVLIGNVVLVFFISFYLMLDSHYLITFASGYYKQGKKLIFQKQNYKPISKFMLAHIIYLFIIYLYQIAVAINFFARPYVVSNLSGFENLHVYIAIYLYLIILVIAAMIAGLFISKSSNINKKGRV